MTVSPIRVCPLTWATLRPARRRAAARTSPMLTPRPHCYGHGCRYDDRPAAQPPPASLSNPADGHLACRSDSGAFLRLSGAWAGRVESRRPGMVQDAAGIRPVVLSAPG